MAGEMLNEPVMTPEASREIEPLPAASALLLRDGPLEVLMLRRHEKSSFVPGAWVFPGGVAEPADARIARSLADGSELSTMRVAAIRETFEESGVWIGEELPDATATRRELLDGHLSFEALTERARPDLTKLVWTSRWITPVGIPKRFDTYFFLVAVPRESAVAPDQREVVESIWISPAEALRRHGSGAMTMVFPTLRNLEAIAPFATSDALLATRRDARIDAIEPVLVNGRPVLAPDRR